MKLFRGVFMNYDDLYKLYSLFNNNRSSSENMDWFDDYIEDVFGKESYYVNRVIVSLPSSTVMPTDRGFVTESELTKCFPFR
jgi:hypothetical protein